LTSGEATATHGTILWTTSNGLGTISDETTLTPTYHAVAGDEGHAVVLTLTVTSDNTCGTATATATYTINVDALRQQQRRKCNHLFKQYIYVNQW
jgi:hypothetical protein